MIEQVPQALYPPITRCHYTYTLLMVNKCWIQFNSIFWIMFLSWMGVIYCKNYYILLKVLHVSLLKRMYMYKPWAMKRGMLSHFAYSTAASIMGGNRAVTSKNSWPFAVCGQAYPWTADEQTSSGWTPTQPRYIMKCNITLHCTSWYVQCFSTLNAIKKNGFKLEMCFC